MSRRAAIRSVIVVAPCGYGLADTIREDEGTDQLRAWTLAAIETGLGPRRKPPHLEPGPCVVRGIEVLARILHPALFGAPSSKDALAL